MAILKIVPEEVYQVLMEYLSDSDVVLLPESVLADFSPEIQRKFRRMDQEGQIDYDFGGMRPQRVTPGYFYIWRINGYESVR